MLATIEADAVLEAVERLGVPYGLERSFRLSDSLLITRRFLTSFALSENLAETLPRFAAELGFPDSHADRLRRSIAPARFVHLGFEETDDRGGTLKLYLEFAPTADPLHLAFKWSPDACVVSRYRSGRALGLSGVLSAVSSALPPGAIAQEARSLILTAARRMRGETPPLLDVVDEGTRRRSVDVNLYDAEIPLRAVAPPIEAIARRLHISLGRLREHMNPIGDDGLGHLAAGVHRDGRPFATIFHGVEARDARA